MTYPLRKTDNGKKWVQKNLKRCDRQDTRRWKKTNYISSCEISELWL